MQTTQSPFISWRWLTGLALMGVLLVVLMTLAYVLAGDSGPGTQGWQANVLWENSRIINQRLLLLADEQRQQAQRIASTNGILTADGDLPQLAEQAKSSSLIVLDAQGLERAGIYRTAGADGYGPVPAVNWPDVPLVQNLLQTGSVQTGLVQTPAGYLLVSGARVVVDNLTSGVVLVGQEMAALLASLPDSAAVELAFYDSNQQMIQTTLDGANPGLTAGAAGVPQTINLGGQDYAALYEPVVVDGNAIGTIGILLPETAANGGMISRQTSGLLLAGLVAAVIIGVFLLINRLLSQVQRVTRTAEALAAGEITARTSMRPGNEIGRLGYALDQYATLAEERQDLLRADLRRQRREVTYLLSVLESLPDGAVVLDMDGHVILMNERARGLLGSQQVNQEKDIQTLTALVTDMLGPSLAPGIYSLGSPHRLDVAGRLLSAQAAAVMTLTDQRVGTVVILRDITEDVRRERTREQMLAQITETVEQPLDQLVTNQTGRDAGLGDFAREIKQHALSLHRLVLEMRELTDHNLQDLPENSQQVIPLDTLVWSVANEWRQIAQANNLTLHVMIDRNGLQVPGNERRLRWALGNLVDNAVKYTPPGGDLTLEIRDDVSEGLAHLRIRDNGVGIARDELPLVFERFYRGNPVTKEGRVIRMPGTGQGLSTAQQIFEAHGGSLNIKSRQGVGTAAYINLPLAVSKPESHAAGEAELEDETMPVSTQHTGELR